MTTKSIAYITSASVFSTDAILDSLASSSTWLAGYESPTIDNSSTLFLDVALAGRFKANNSAPTAGQIRVYVGALLDDSKYPDVFDGTESAETVTSADIRDSILKQAAIITTDATANRVYEFALVSIAQLFGGIMPRKWFVFVTHSMVTALNATANNGGQCWYTGIKSTDA